MDLPFTVTEKSRNVHVISMDAAKAGWEQWFLLRSDAHHDNRHCNWDLEKKHLDQALERNAGIIDYGDLHCAMQGKWDKRASAEALRDIHLGDDYLDRLVNTAVDFYAPYAKNWILMGPGNHETSVLKRHGVHLTQSTVDRLKERTKANIYFGGYSGWIRFSVDRSGARKSFRLFYHHGYGGGGPVTRGVIQTNRMAVYLPDADIIASGHTHDHWLMPIERVRITEADVVKKDRQYHVRTAGYKDEYAEGMGGWHIERGAPPKPLGAVWLRFYRGYENHQPVIKYELSEAN